MDKITIKEISITDLIINFWKYKLTFFFILLSLLLFSFFLDIFIEKKSKNFIYFQHPLKINLDVYPEESTLSSVVLYNLASMDIDSIKIRDQKISINYFDSYFIPDLMSSKMMLKFAQKTNDQYDLFEYIKDNNISVHRERANLKYSLILPDDDSNENFFMEYFYFAAEQSLNSFKDDVIRHQNKNLNTIIYDMDRVDKILENKIDSNNIFKENINIIMALYKSRKIQLEQNIIFYKKLNFDLDQDWILDVPFKQIVNEKFKKVIKYILPIILSLIIYLLYILFKLVKQDEQN